MNDDEVTPVDRPIWTMRPEATRVRSSSKPGVETEIEVPQTGKNQRVLEEILETAQGVLNESRDIKISSQRACQLAIDAVASIPALQKRMARLELLMLLFAMVNAVTMVSTIYAQHR